MAAITHARPDIADYPFTTLMPNLGRLDGDPSLGADKYSSEATLADLPGLIEGAHLGKVLFVIFSNHFTNLTRQILWFSVLLIFLTKMKFSYACVPNYLIRV